MTDAGAPPPVSKGRRTTFIVLTVLFGLGAGVAGFAFLGLVAAFFGLAPDREIHAVHDIGWGAHGGVLLAIPYLIQAVNPERKPAVMLAAALSGLALIVGYGLGGVWFLVPIAIVLIALLWWLHPARAEILPSDSRLHPAMAALAFLAAIPLVMYALDEVTIQQGCPPSGDQHCDEFHFSVMASLAYALPLVALGASLRTRGWRIVAWLVGAAAVVFGLSGIVFPDNLSSIGPAWGGIAVVGGVLFVGVAEWVGRAARGVTPG